MHELRETGREALTVGNNTRGEGQRLKGPICIFFQPE
ncbi:hypothetical protein NC653_008410 [Populus alba x Populus x berolinensis]|uniref:Uncharacterized protein n=1 Tax=Populus alba x Populus x berolinensis TaxID=444605 RepID=A0AAD6R7F8_9ROSI|nr:hypothetical protein NC653_008410 [Populus alba x Populus x berolinensis]